jgi:hypothetical protein
MGATRAKAVQFLMPLASALGARNEPNLLMVY